MNQAGVTLKQIAVHLDVNHNTVGNWIKIWEKVGIVGLNRKIGQGRSPILSVTNAIQIQHLDKAVDTHSQNVKAIQADLVKELNTAMSSDTAKRFFKKNYYLWPHRRTGRIRRCTHQGQNKVVYADKYERWKLLLALWLLGYIELYFADESGFTMQPYVPYGWQKKE